MEIRVDERNTYVYTGTRPIVSGRPSWLFVHGAGMDHSVWILQSRYFAFHGANVLAVDLLLRVLQDGQIERVGEDRTRAVDVRIIAATNRNLEQEVKRGRFRQDLYFRLNVFPIRSVPLRERREDIPALAEEFVRRANQHAKQPHIRLTQADLHRLITYDWPGNVRELENVIERAIILGQAGRLRLELPGTTQPPGATTTPFKACCAPNQDSAAVLNETERRQRDRDNILAALKACQYKVFGKGGAAELMGVPPTTLASRMKALGIKREGKKA